MLERRRNCIMVSVNVVKPPPVQCPDDLWPSVKGSIPLFPFVAKNPKAMSILEHVMMVYHTKDWKYNLHFSYTHNVTCIIHTSSTYIQTHTHTKYTYTYTHTNTHTCHVYTNHNKHVMYCSSGIRNTHPLIPRLAPLLVVQQTGHGQHVETILMRVDGSIDIMRLSFKNSKKKRFFFRDKRNRNLPIS